ncbi:MAG: Ribonuclease P protein component [uncultured Truepera sp.]|uniref:Ribonuclease P protein component n=1 Tax=uncultured Truepera sp. TaxID=543023 RepID=A0A6J4V841_9DEIN|nr:MAG: Ribonuclease P protein component [uncultured Truepera sp.]
MTVIQSLKGDRAFGRLRRGRAGHAKFLSLRWRAVREDGVRVGIVVSKKVGKAVVRNRVRRRLREALRATLLRAETGRKDAFAFEVVIIARPESAEADYWQLEGALEHALRKGQAL